MELSLDQERVKLTDSDLLGEGGEARVYRYRELALKVFHAPPAALTAKVKKLETFPRGLPGAVLGPLALVRNGKGEAVGYAMKALRGAEDFARLSQKAWRLAHLPATGVLEAFRELAQVVQALHGAGVVVGDFNDGNVLLLKRQPYLIDADSMQFAGLACTVGHERFLDPRLYGVDLTKTAAFSEGSDWYAFAVMLFSSLLSVHPFGGVHPSLGTLLRRAEARHSLFQRDVKLPRSATAPTVLPDDAQHWFRSVFEKDLRTPPPASLLSLPWSTCSCGLEHARAVCPACHTLGPLVTRPVMRVHGRCTARTVFQTRGRVLAAAMQGGLRYAYEEGGVVWREDGTRVAESAEVVQVGLSGPVTWLADARGGLVQTKQGQVVERAQTQLVGRTPAFACTSQRVLHLEGAWLMEHHSGARLGQVLEGQTRVWAGEALALALYRAGGFTQAMLFQPWRAGLKRLPEVTWTGRLLEAEAVFDAHHALLSVVTELDGAETVRRWLSDASGALLAIGEGGARGRAALLDGRVVLATDGGLVGLTRDAGRLFEARSFPDTQPFVSASDQLLPQPDGSLCVVGASDITQLSLT
jgi:hypothetical protein